MIAVNVGCESFPSPYTTQQSSDTAYVSGAREAGQSQLWKKYAPGNCCTAYVLILSDYTEFAFPPNLTWAGFSEAAAQHGPAPKAAIAGGWGTFLGIWYELFD